MKTKFLLTVFLFSISLQLLAQNPLVGTWKYDTDSTTSIKIITPTHWMIYTQATTGDRAFIRAHGGSYTVSGNKYVENIDVASWENYGKEKTDYTWKVEGDNFHQKGKLTLADGTKVPIDERWKRVSISPQENPFTGAWNQLSSSGKNSNGEEWSHTNATHIRFQAVSPTHWIRIAEKDKKFESAMAGTYRMEGTTLYPVFEMSSIPVSVTDFKIAQRKEGAKLYWDVEGTDDNGKFSFTDIFEKATPKTGKTASTK